MIKEDLEELLREINVILQKEKVKKAESRKRGERFNMFELLGVAHYELKHSKIIACFLDPKGSHGQGDLFLKLFLQIINDESNLYPSKTTEEEVEPIAFNRMELDTSKAKVDTEYDINDNGRIDILIRDDLGKGVIIENKIYANDQHEQLIRYENFAKKALKEHVIYYLTLYGSDASEDSAKNVEYRRISYSKHIVKWLQCCIQHSATMPAIRESLVQYLNHVKQLTNQDMDYLCEQELIELLSSEKYFRTAFSAASFFDEHFNEIKEKGQEKIVEHWKIEINKSYPNITVLDNPKKYDSRAFFVVEIDKIHAYIGWHYVKHKGQKTNLFCQAEYGSYESDNRPKLDDTFEKLRLHEILDDDKTDFCRNKSFGKEYIDFEKAFNCLKKVIERIVESQIHQ